MKNAIAMAAVLLAGTFAQANFTGNWVGTGRVSNNQGLNLACEKVTLDITQTATEMDVNTLFYCGGKTIQGPAGVLTVKGTSVFNAAGAPMGTLTDSNCNLSLSDASGFLSSAETITGNAMTFKTVRGDSKSGVTTTFEGTATR